MLCLSHIHYVLNTVAASFSILGIYELLRAVRANNFGRMLVLYLLSIMICFFEFPYYPVMLSIVWGIAVIVFFILMKRIGRYHFASFASILPCTIMLPLFFRSLVELRLAEHGLYYLILVILGCIFNDVTADGAHPCRASFLPSALDFQLLPSAGMRRPYPRRVLLGCR